MAHFSDSPSARFETRVNFNPEIATKLRLCQDVVDFLDNLGESVEDLAKQPIVVAPGFDDSQSLTSYFVSTSHNTYLLGDQLWGKASPSAYTHVLINGAHCVEIDVWPGSDNGSGPVVTHGWTLAQQVPFKAVCVAISDAVDTKKDDWPIFVSLECHVDVKGQKELVDIMEGAWGEKLVKSAVEIVDTNSVGPKDLKDRILLMVEYYPAVKLKSVPNESGSSSSSSSSSDSDTGNKDREKKPPKPKISEELAALGVYAQSMKPKKNWLKEQLARPLHILINISESALAALVPHALHDLVSNGQKHLRRVYPRGTRIASGNLDPIRCWRAGSHFAAMNWQEYDRGMQINEAMFAGTPGWVLKPSTLLGGPTAERKTKLTLDIAGLSSLPHPDNDKNFSLRIRVQLLHSSGDKTWKSKSVRCKDVSHVGADAMFNERCEWEFDLDELAFVRIIVTEDELGRDDHLAVFCARILYIQQGWRFVRLLSTKGKDTHASMLVNFTLSDVE